MALKFAIQTIFEIIVVVLIIYGFIHEDKLIAFEERAAERVKKRMYGQSKKERRAKGG